MKKIILIIILLLLSLSFFYCLTNKVEVDVSSAPESEKGASIPVALFISFLVIGAGLIVVWKLILEDKTILLLLGIGLIVLAILSLVWGNVF